MYIIDRFEGELAVIETVRISCRFPGMNCRPMRKKAVFWPKQNRAGCVIPKRKPPAVLPLPRAEDALGGVE